MTKSEDYEAAIQTMQWDELRTLWRSILDRNTPGWDSGKAFEYLILRTFQLDGASVTWPYSTKLFGDVVEQIDGAIYYKHLACLAESKDLKDGTLVNVEPIAKLRNQLLRRPTHVLGLLFSRTGFTAPARQLSHFSLPQAILLWNGEEIGYALEKESICDLLMLKYRVCVEHGLPDYDVRESGI